MQRDLNYSVYDLFLFSYNKEIVSLSKLFIEDG